MIELTLPIPPSANRYWRTFTPRGHKRALVVVSEEARAYKADIAAMAMISKVRPLQGRVSLTVRLYPSRPLDWKRRASKDALGWDDTVRCIDLDNALKVLIDALKGIAYGDDSWVRIIHAERCEPDEKGGRVEVIIEEID